MVNHQQRESLAKIYMMTVTLGGWTIIFGATFQIHSAPDSFLTLLLLIILLGITEYYPFPVWKGFTTINFPILFIMLLMYGLPVTTLVYSMISLVVNLLHKRPIRSMLFNPAQLIISLYLTYVAVTFSYTIDDLAFTSNVIKGLITYVSFLIIFYTINNLLVDIVLWLRPQPYTFNNWKEKLISESASGMFSILYGVVFYVLGNQNRGEVDVFTYFFFFSPLIAMALIGSSFVRLNTEKNRLNRMFRLTRNLNTYMLKDGFLESMTELKDFMNCDEVSLLIRSKETWHIAYPDISLNIHSETEHKLNDLQSMVSYEQKIGEPNGPLSFLFSKEMRSFIYVPLRMDDETLGMIVLSKSRPQSFIEAEKNVLATLANQIAATLKTRNLVKEQQERHLLEERNRIARNIHDGIAQNLAAAILQLESLKQTLHTNTEQSESYLERCMEHLRTSLWEVRNSIYTLRPPKTNQTGLIPAIHKKINTLEHETIAQVNFNLKGKPYPVSTMVEKTIFDIFQEALQNSIKHSKAENINITLCYLTNELILTISDDGIGFSLFHEMIRAENEPHFGILQMNEIADKISASLDIQSKQDEGTTIKLTIPQLESEGGSYDSNLPD